MTLNLNNKDRNIQETVRCQCDFPWKLGTVGKTLTTKQFLTYIYTKNKQRNNSKQYNTDLLCLLQGGSSSPKNTGFVRLRTTTTIFQQAQSRKTIDAWTLVDRKYHEIDQAVPPLGFWRCHPGQALHCRWACTRHLSSCVVRSRASAPAAGQSRTQALVVGCYCPGQIWWGFWRFVHHCSFQSRLWGVFPPADLDPDPVLCCENRVMYLYKVLVGHCETIKAFTSSKTMSHRSMRNHQVVPESVEQINMSDSQLSTQIKNTQNCVINS